jgi:hypothetical protein
LQVWGPEFKPQKGQGEGAKGWIWTVTPPHTHNPIW